MSELAQRVTALIAPFVPYLVDRAKQAGTEFVKAIAEPAGKAAWEAAKSLWDRCSAFFSGDAKIESAIVLVASDPEETAFHVSLEKALEKYFAAHPEHARTVDDAMKEPAFVQLVRASGKGKIKDVEQRGSGEGGRQEVIATDESAIEGVKQGMFVERKP